MITHVNIIYKDLVVREKKEIFHPSMEGGTEGIRRSVFTCERLDHSSLCLQHENNKEDEDAPPSSSSTQSCHPLIIEYLLQSCI